MKAIIVNKPGDVDQLEMSEQPKPIPNAQELLIKVKAIGINRLDIINRQRAKPYSEPLILGAEIAGIVEKSSKDLNIKEGDRVMGIVSGGAYAEYALIPADRAIIIPDNLSFEEAAAIPEVFLTAYQTLFWHGSLEENETVLIHAGGSGVGTAAIQLAKQLKNANVITTAGSQAKLDFAKSLGANHTINYKEQSFDQEVLNITDEKGVDLILDFIGASYWNKNIKSIKVDGRWVLIGTLGGSMVEKVNLAELMMKRIELTGTLLTPRSDAYKAKLTKDFSEKTFSLFEKGQLKPIVDRVFKFDQMKEAHKYMEADKNIGKIIVRLDD